MFGRIELRIFLALFGIALLVTGAFWVRVRLVTPWRLADAQLNAPWNQGSIVLIKNFNFSQDLPYEGNVVSIRDFQGNKFLRRFAGTSGDTLHFNGKNKLSNGSWKHEWKEEPWMVEPAMLVLPGAGDTLRLDFLSHMELEMLVNHLRALGWDSLSSKTHLEVAGRPLPENRLIEANLYGRPLNHRILQDLSWQELRMVEMQLQGREHYIRRVRARRIVEHKGQPLEFVVLPENTFFAVCDADRCRDSRQMGYLPLSNLIGIPLYPRPDATVLAAPDSIL